jgi:hypothetical protein
MDKRRKPSDGRVRPVLACLILAAVLLSAGPARAKEVVVLSGNALLEICKTQSGMCGGYVAGIADAMDDAQASNGSVQGWRACFPNGVSFTQEMDLAKRYLKNHPETRHLSAATLVARALAEAFPCPAPK